MEQNLVLHLCTLYCFTGVANKEISRGKLFILSGKVRENEFYKVVGTLVFGYAVQSLSIKTYFCKAIFSCLLEGF